MLFRSNIPTVGKIVYKKNEGTKANDQEGKRTPFIWRDPSAFYLDNEFKSMNSTKEDQAAENKDLERLIPVRSIVAMENENHQGWSLVVPTTNPKNNKTFDHRQLELKDFSPETIRALMLAKRSSGRSEGFNGWDKLKPGHPAGIDRKSTRLNSSHCTPSRMPSSA